MIGIEPITYTVKPKHTGKLWYGSYYVTNLNAPPFRPYVRVLVRSAEVRWSPTAPTALIVGAKSCGIMPSCFRKDGNWCFECGSIIKKSASLVTSSCLQCTLKYLDLIPPLHITSVPKRNNDITQPSSNVQLTREIVVPFSTSLLR